MLCSLSVCRTLRHFHSHAFSRPANRSPTRFLPAFWSLSPIRANEGRRAPLMRLTDALSGPEDGRAHLVGRWCCRRCGSAGLSLFTSPNLWSPFICLPLFLGYIAAASQVFSFESHTHTHTHFPNKACARPMVSWLSQFRLGSPCPELLAVGSMRWHVKQLKHAVGCLMIFNGARLASVEGDREQAAFWICLPPPPSSLSARSSSKPLLLGS